MVIFSYVGHVQHGTASSAARLTMLSELADRHGLAVVNVPSDGNCFLHAVVDQLRTCSKNDEDWETVSPMTNIHNLRQEAVKFLRQNSCFTDKDFFVTSEYKDKEAYLSEQSRDGHWCDEAMIRAVSHSVQRKITVFHDNGHITTISPNGEVCDADFPVITVGQIAEDHYVSMRRKVAEGSLSNKTPGTETNDVTCNTRTTAVTHGCFAYSHSHDQHEQSKTGEKFHPPKSFKFPRREFGSKGEQRSFRPEWCEMFEWLHYDVNEDAAYCHVCISAERERKFLSSTRRDPCFISKGFTYWKEGISAFKKHTASACHWEAVTAIRRLPNECADVAESLNTEHQKEKAVNRKMFLIILQCLRYLARQGLAIRGHDDDHNSNFIQLLHLRAFDHPAITKWIDKKTCKYIAPDIQNECLQLMALNVLRQINHSIFNNGFFTIMADECTDVANREQFTICIRWIDDDLYDHEDFIGLFNVGTIDANCLTSTIRDVLVRMNLKLSMCRGQCYDGASNMTGSKNGVSAQIQAEEHRAVYTHCYGHALNLAVGDALKKSKLCCDALDTAFEICRLVRFSPKRHAAFERIKLEDGANPELSVASTGIRAFCATRWTVRAAAVASIIDNYRTLLQLWDECLETKLDADVKCRVIGVRSQMLVYKLLFGLELSNKILRITDNLSKTLQTQSMTAAEAQKIAEISVQTLKDMRTGESFTLFFQFVNKLRQNNDVAEAVLPRAKKAPRRFEVGSGEGSSCDAVDDHYRRQYFEALDCAIAGITDRFDQPGYAVYRNLEGLLVNAANNAPHEEYLDRVTSFYKDDVNRVELSAQLRNLGTRFSKERQTSTVSLSECLEYLRSLSPSEKSFYSEVVRLARLILVMPATNAVSERCFSAMRRLKTYLRSTMQQKRLNHVMVLHLHKERLDKLNLVDIGNEFVRESEHRARVFGSFAETR